MSEKEIKKEESSKDNQNNKDIGKDDKGEKLSVEEKLAETEDKLLRSLAEIEKIKEDDLKKEIKDAFEFGSFNFAKESLSILDNLEKRAKAAIEKDETLKKNQDLNKFIENINIIQKDLIAIFEKNKIKKIQTSNQKFNPNLHQAISELENDAVEPGVVLQEIQGGYMFGERLLRPAMVIVAKKKLKNDEKKDKKEGK